MQILGAVLALVSAAFWALTSVLWRRMGDEMSPYDMNLAKGLLGGVYLALALSCVGAKPVGAGEFLCLGLSGIFGIALGDGYYFMSLISLGPRLATLLLGTLSPLLTAVLAVVFLKERPSPAAWAGIFIAVGAAAWVMADGRTDEAAPQDWITGVRQGLISALCMALGTVLAKKGAATAPAIEATLIRIVCGLGALILWGAAKGRMKESLSVLFRPSRFLRLSLIVLIVTFGGLWLSIRALQYADAWLVGLCLTTVPLLILPMTAIMLGERIRLRAVLGTTIVVGAVALALAT